MIELSIVIVSWNAKEFLCKCIDSIFTNCDRFNFEVIVVDNASHDGSVEMVQKKFPMVTVICNDRNLGFAKANNVGIRLSQGNYICLINSDVEVLSNCFDLMVDYIKKNSDVGMLGPMMLNSDGTLQRSCRGYSTLWNLFCRALALDLCFPNAKLFGGRLMTYWDHNDTQEVEVINGCFWMVGKEALSEVGLLDEKFFIYAEDVDWCKRFNDAGWKVVYYPIAKAIHYGGASSNNAPIQFYLEMYRANLQYWKKHHNFFAQAAYLVITLLHHIVRISVDTILFIIIPSKRSEYNFKIKRSIACIKWILSFNYSKAIINE